MKYKLTRHHCNCHPETCNCNDWDVIDPGGNRLFGVYDRKVAKEVVDRLNSTLPKPEVPQQQCSTLECYSEAVAISVTSNDPHCLKCSLAIVERFGTQAMVPIEGVKFPWEYPHSFVCDRCGLKFNKYVIGMTGDCPSCRKPLPREKLKGRN